MKELSIEELENIFPELKESECEKDECMLNNIIDTLRALSETTHSGYAINSMIAWLKKHCNIDKVSYYIVEKAKAYDEAIVHAKLLLKTIGNATLGNLVLKHEFEIMFPELKESEDERIRKEIVDFINRVYERQALIITDEERDNWIAWLEKQGEKGTNGNEREIPFIEPPLTIKHAREVMGIKQDDAWGEEDETKLITAQTFIRNTSLIGNDGIKEATIDWLKSLKERVQLK